MERYRRTFKQPWVLVELQRQKDLLTIARMCLRFQGFEWFTSDEEILLTDLKAKNSLPIGVERRNPGPLFMPEECRNQFEVSFVVFLNEIGR